MPKFLKNSIYLTFRLTNSWEIMRCCHAFGLKNRNFRGFSSGKEVPKLFSTAAAKSAA